jgi:hypothetical protein
MAGADDLAASCALVGCGASSDVAACSMAERLAGAVQAVSNISANIHLLGQAWQPRSAVAVHGPLRAAIAALREASIVLERACTAALEASPLLCLLPQELIVHVFSWSDAPAMSALDCTSKQVRLIVRDSIKGSAGTCDPLFCRTLVRRTVGLRL